MSFMDYPLVKDEVRKNGVTSFMHDPYILIWLMIISLFVCFSLSLYK